MTHDEINDPFFLETPDSQIEGVQDIMYQQSEEDDFGYGEGTEQDAFEIMTQEKRR